MNKIISSNEEKNNGNKKQTIKNKVEKYVKDLSNNLYLLLGDAGTTYNEFYHSNYS